VPLLFGLFASSPIDDRLNDLEIDLSFKATMIIAAIDTDFDKRVFTLLHVDLDGGALFEVYDLVEEVEG
jgi:hypothetical protein